MPTRPRIARRFLGLIACAGLTLAACAGGDERAAGEPLPLGRLVAPEPVTCAPSSDWSPAPDDGWEFRGIAELACWLDEPAPERLGFRLRPRPPTGRDWFRLAWDGRPLEDGPRRAGPELAVEVPGSLLGPGRHRLTVERYRLQGDSRRPGNVFDPIEVSAGAAPVRRLESREAARFHRLADFLLLGATGSGGLNTAGWLAAGPGSFELALPPGSERGPERRLRMLPENLSAAPAELRVEVDGEVHAVDLGTGERGRLEVPVPRGAERLRLAAAGAADGLFLFGAPRWVAVAREPFMEPPPPPIVLITLDTTRRDALGAYAGSDSVTPTLDRLAAVSTVFEEAVSTTSWTLPAHVSMFTGLYPSRHGLGVHRRFLPDAMPTLAGLLRWRGYAPVGVAGGLLMAARLGGARDFLLYRDPAGGIESSAEEVTDHALELLEETEGEVPFLFVNYFDPHHPYAAPAPFRERAGEPQARDRIGSEVWRRAAAGDGHAWRRLVAGEAELSEDGLAWLRAAYRAEVAAMDHQLGRLFAELERRRLWDDALIAVVADHGELLGESGYLTHGFRLDPELVEVPLLIKAPGQRRGRRVSGVVSVTDLFPTLLDAAGVQAPPVDGRALDRAADLRGSRRSRVLFEEHVSRIHPLDVEHLRLAYHVWGFQGAGRRAVAWDGGAECARRDADGAWRTEPCAGERLLAALQRLLGPPSAEAAAAAGELAEDRREALEALGYL
ncbi:MAG TPA: sulfatase [Thermoanaerobaculia bacterium]|nr:sulfatase [Thermoanaerobaculia bacterium]